MHVHLRVSQRLFKMHTHTPNRNTVRVIIIKASCVVRTAVVLSVTDSCAGACRYSTGLQSLDQKHQIQSGQADSNKQLKLTAKNDKTCRDNRILNKLFHLLGNKSELEILKGVSTYFGCDVFYRISFLSIRSKSNHTQE